MQQMKPKKIKIQNLFILWFPKLNLSIDLSCYWQEIIINLGNQSKGKKFNSKNLILKKKKKNQTLKLRLKSELWSGFPNLGGYGREEISVRWNRCRGDQSSKRCESLTLFRKSIVPPCGEMVAQYFIYSWISQNKTVFWLTVVLEL